MLDILYYLLYTERKKKTHIRNAEGGGGERSHKEAVEKVCLFKWGEWGGRKKKKSYIRTQERGDVFPKITVNRFPAGDFPHGPAVKNPAANAGDTGSIPGRGRCHLPRRSEARALQPLKPAHPEPQPETHRRDRPGAAGGGQPGRSRGDPAQPNTQTDKITLKHENCKREREKSPA